MDLTIYLGKVGNLKSRDTIKLKNENPQKIKVEYGDRSDMRSGG